MTTSFASIGNQGREYWNDWKNSTPVVTRFLVFSLTFIALIATITGASLPLIFGNIPLLITLNPTEAYRLVTSCIALSGPLDYLFTVMMLSSFGTRVEKAIGSISFAIMLFTLGLVCNTSYLLITLLLAYNPLYAIPSALTLPCLGFFPILYGIFVWDCLQDPESRRMFWPLPVTFQAKVLPVVFILFFSMFFGLQLSSVVATAVGYGYTLYIQRLSQPSMVTLQTWECATTVGMWLSHRDGFISSSACSNFNSLLPFQSANTATYRLLQHNPPPPPPPVNTFEMAPPAHPVEFPTENVGKGIVLGTASGVHHLPGNRDDQRAIFAAAAEARINTKPDESAFKGLSLKK